MKIFVDADADVRLARRIRRDMAERGRDLDGVLQQCARARLPAPAHLPPPTLRPSQRPRPDPRHADAPNLTLTSTCGLTRARAALGPDAHLPTCQPPATAITTTTTRYEQFVKPSYETFIGPSKSHADIVVPRGAENLVAIELIAQHINSLLIEREAESVALEWDAHERARAATLPGGQAVDE